MANISMSEKEVNALYFLIGSQEAHLESCEDKEYIKEASNSINLAEKLIRKYYISNKRRKEKESA